MATVKRFLFDGNCLSRRRKFFDGLFVHTNEVDIELPERNDAALCRLQIHLNLSTYTLVDRRTSSLRRDELRGVGG